MAITLHYQNRSMQIQYEPSNNQNIASLVFLSGHIPLRPLCAGIGHCGKCRIRFISQAPELTPTELSLLSKEEQEKGVRLACKHQAQDNINIELLETEILYTKQINLNPQYLKQNNIPPEKVQLFIDLGTTSIAWQCMPFFKEDDVNQYGVSQNKSQKKQSYITYPTYPSGQALNPQMIAGSDIMARLFVASHQKQALYLQTLIKEHFQDICESLFNDGYHVEEIYLAANPAMLAIALGTDFSGLCEAPYALADKGNRRLQLEGLPPIWIPPQIGAFLGADACAGLAYVLAIKNKEHITENTTNAASSFILADMGTNGEFIRYTTHNMEQKLLGVSVPLGPALEGVGMRCGGPVLSGMEGIILKFTLNPQGLNYDSQGNPTHICGAAYLGLIHILLSVGIINREGHFQNSSLPLARKMMQKIQKIQGETRFYINDTLYLCAEDIENILKVKAAFVVALQTLMKNENIDTIFLAGSLSEHIPMDHLINLGFIPKSHGEKTRVIGNSSLKGLMALAHIPHMKATLSKLVNDATVIDLPHQTSFTQAFIDEMHF